MSVVTCRLGATTRGATVNDTMKALLGFIKGWKGASDPVFRAIGWVAGVLAIAACIRNEHPVGLVVGFARSIGRSELADWFETGLPPLVYTQRQMVADALVLAAEIVVFILLVGPFVRAKSDNWPVDLQAKALLRSRASCTFWILLMIATQFGSPARVAVRMCHAAFVFAVIVGILLAGTWMFYLMMGQLGLSDFVASPIEFARHVLIVAVMVVLALGVVILGPVVAVVMWMLSLEPESNVDLKRRLNDDLGLFGQPTGSAQVSSRGPGTGRLPHEKQQHDGNGSEPV